MKDMPNPISPFLRMAEDVGAVRLRETPWGYVIRSCESELRCRAAMLLGRFGPTTALVLTVAMVILPLGLPQWAGLAMGSGLCSVVFATLYLMRNPGGYEVHVDTARREVRAAVVRADGASWVQMSARFDEVGEPVLIQPHRPRGLYSLALKVHGEEEPLRIARGYKPALIGIYDRLRADLQPVEARMASAQMLASPTAARGGRVVFPDLGPSEIAI